MSARAESAVRNGPLPLHHQVFLALRDQILDGRHPSGSALPTEAAMCVEFGVSRITVRRALADLADVGFVDRRQGRRTIVLERRTPKVERHDITLMGGLRKVGRGTQVKVIEVRTDMPPDAVRRSLRLSHGSQALFVRRVRSVRGSPLLLSDVWLPTRFSDVLTEQTLAKRAMYELLGAAGVRYGRMVQTITAEVAGPVRGGLLQVEGGAALLRIDRVLYDQAEEPVHSQSLSIDPSRAQLVMDIGADEFDIASAGRLTPAMSRHAGSAWS